MGGRIGASRDGPLVLRGGVLDLQRGRFRTASGVRVLTTKELAVVRWLSARPGVVVPRDELLTEVWGYAPTTLTRAIDVAVRRLRAKIERDPSSPEHLITVPGVGYRFEPLGGMSADPSAPAVRSETDGFVGREAELTALADAVAEGPLVTLTGPGGVGKTRLARRFLTLHGERFQGGVVFCELAEVREAGGVLAAVAQAIGVPIGTDSDEAAARRIGRALAARGSPLVVLDNFEQLVGPARATVAAWTRAAPACRWIVTSREPLDLEGERRIGLQGLSLDDAVALFLRRAREVRPGAEAADRRLVGQIVERVDGLPLAIELAAARLRVLGVADLLSRLDDPLRILGRPGDREARHGTLRGVIESSWRALPPNARAALAQCSVFRGGFTLEAAEAVVEDLLPEVLELLCDRSLLRASAGPVPRFSMFEAIRRYASEQLANRDEAEERHAAYYVRLAEACAASLGGRGAHEARGTLLAESANLLAVHERLRLRKPELAVRAVLAFEGPLAPRGPVDQVQRLLDDVVALSEPLGTRWSAAARLARGRASLYARPEAARRDLQAALALAEADGAADRVAEATTGLGVLALRIGALEEAEALLDRALERTAGSARGVVLGHLAHLRYARGDLTAAEATLAEALRLHREAGNRVEEARALGNQGVLLLLARRHDEARRSLDLAIEGNEAIGDRRALAANVENLGILAVELGRYDEALDAYDRALRLHREVGNLGGEGVALGNLGLARLARGELDLARHLFEQALAIHREIGDRRSVGVELAHLGHVCLAKRSQGAAAYLEEAAHELATVGDRRGEGYAVGLLAVARTLDGHPEAGPTFAQARRLAASWPVMARMIEVLELVGGAGDREATLARARAEAPRSVDVRLALDLVAVLGRA